MAISVRCPSCGGQFRAKDQSRGKSASCTRCGKDLVIEGAPIRDYDVFVSYSSKDKQICDAVVATLEAAHIRCWVAPRDIAPGAEWGASIISGIANSRTMVLIFTGNSNVSPQVLREVERAVNKGLSVVPVRIDESPLSPNMEYFISTSHWLDAMTPPLEGHLAHLVQSVRALMDGDSSVECQAEIVPGPQADSEAKSSSDALIHTTPSTQKQGKSRATLIASVLASLAIVGFMALHGPIGKILSSRRTSNTSPQLTPAPVTLVKTGAGIASPAVVSTTAPLQVTNLAVNGNFENLIGNLPAGWKMPDRGQCSIVSENGNHYLRIRSKIADGSVCVGQAIHLKPGWESVTARCQMRAQGLNRGPESWHQVQLGFEFQDDNGNRVGEWPAMAVLHMDSDWTVKSKTLRIPEGATVLGLTCGVVYCDATADFDDVEVTASGPALPEAVTTSKANVITNSLGMKFVPIPAGEFMMGSPENEEGRQPIETLHKVRITKPFYMGVYHVTRGQFAAFVDADNYKTDAEKSNGATTWRTPYFQQTDDHPVVRITLNDVVKFIDWLNAKEKDQGRHYRLPTEAEWEYACRAGTSTRFNTGDSDDALAQAGWYSGNSGPVTHPVGTKTPNAWDLFDMHGNAFQWCSDFYGPYTNDAGRNDASDPKGSSDGENSGAHIMRGGSSGLGSQHCRAAYRYWNTPGYQIMIVGFRLCLDTLTLPSTSPTGTNSTPTSSPGPTPTTGPSDPRILINTVGMKFVPIPAGEFMMGSPENEEGRKPNEAQHNVKITKPFYMGMHHVTRGQFAAFVDADHYVTQAEAEKGADTWRNPGCEQTDNHPVVCVSWNDAVKFTEWLNTKEKDQRRHYRLPTEAEWEYACRAGTSTRFYSGDSEEALGQAGWYYPKDDGGTRAVGTKAPNKWGLYDMHGDARQWCSDRYGPYVGDAVDPQGPPNHDNKGSRIMRGGSWKDEPPGCRSACRETGSADLRYNCFGFRVCLDQQ